MKTKIIIILSVLLAIFIYISQTKVKPEVIIKTKITYDTIREVVDNTKPQQIKKVYIKIPFETVINDTITQVIYKDKEVNEYKYLDSLKNGIVKSTILADKIYKRDIELITFNKNTEISTTKIHFKSSFYVGGTILLNKNYNVLNPTINVYYNNRNKWLGGLGVGVINNEPNINLTFAIKL